MRTEREIFSDLAKLCVASGYVHVIASLSFRDNVVPYYFGHSAEIGRPERR